MESTIPYAIHHSLCTDVDVGDGGEEKVEVVKDDGKNESGILEALRKVCQLNSKQKDNAEI